ncbi:GNAT family N-acetyltransferase [Angustibacter aerolatus]
MTRYEVRPAVPDDAEELGPVHNQAWRETYAGLMPADFLAGLDDARSVARWRERLEHPAPHVAVHVALADGAVIGFATAGRTRDTDLPEPAHELYAINLLAAHHGTGVAHELLTRTLDAAVGDAAVSLWVVDGNGRAQAFYRRHGFAQDPEHLKRHDETGALELRYVRPAGGGPA